MFKILFFVTAIFSLSHAQQVDSVQSTPSVNRARVKKIDVKHIVLDLRFDWKKKQALGVADITFSPFDTTRKINLDAGMLTINSVRLADGTSLNFSYDGGDKNGGLEILLNRLYQGRDEITVRIDYHTNWVNKIDPNTLGGNFGKGLRFSQPTYNDPVKPYEIWSMGEPQSNRYWFPCYDSPNDLRTTELKATVDKKMTVISNGRLIETKTNSDGTRTFHWKMDSPYPNYLTSIVVGEFTDVQQNYKGVELHSYGYPHETEAVKASVVRLPDMVKFFSELTGVEYPYPRYSQIFVQDIPGGMENMMASTITENMIDDYGTHDDFFYLWDGQEAHVLAGQWFGNYLFCKDWSHQWLNESFAHVLDELYNEHKNGREEFLMWNRQFDHSTYLNDWSSGIRRPVVTNRYADIETMTRDNYSFVRGALVLQMLRQHLGEERWLKALRHFVKTNGNKSVDTEDFRKSIEETTGEPMGWFFDQWIYTMGHPVFEIAKDYDSAKKQLTLTVKQTQTKDAKAVYPQTEYFKGKIKIEIDDRVEEVWIHDQRENVFTFTTAGPPAFVNFDYENVWIKESKFEKNFDELFNQFRNSRDVLARLDALTELCAFVKNEPSSNENRKKLISELQKTIVGNSYWRFRMNVLTQLQNLLITEPTKPVLLDESTISMLNAVIEKDRSWLRAAAIRFLGMTRDPKYADIYIKAFQDSSDRVTNSAAIALGKSKSPKAFEALSKLINKPSWKNQSLMSSLNGLRELNDPRGFDIAFKALSDLKRLRWRLPTPPVWDLRVFAVETIVALGKSRDVYPLISKYLKKSLEEDDLEGIFYNTHLITKLADPRGQEFFDKLKQKYKSDTNTMTAIEQLETQFKESIQK